MNACEVLERITAASVRLAARGGNIVASPKDAVTPELVSLIRDHKPELLKALAAQQAELVRLVNRFADYAGFTAERRQDALQIALGDMRPMASLDLYRLKVGEMERGTFDFNEIRRLAGTD